MSSLGTLGVARREEAEERAQTAQKAQVTKQEDPARQAELARKACHSLPEPDVAVCLPESSISLPVSLCRVFNQQVLHVALLVTASLVVPRMSKYVRPSYVSDLVLVYTHARTLLCVMHKVAKLRSRYERKARARERYQAYIGADKPQASSGAPCAGIAYERCAISWSGGHVHCSLGLPMLPHISVVASLANTCSRITCTPDALVRMSASTSRVCSKHFRDHSRLGACERGEMR